MEKLKRESKRKFQKLTWNTLAVPVTDICVRLDPSRARINSSVTKLGRSVVKNLFMPVAFIISTKLNQYWLKGLVLQALVHSCKKYLHVFTNVTTLELKWTQSRQSLSAIFLTSECRRYRGSCKQFPLCRCIWCWDLSEHSQSFSRNAHQYASGKLSYWLCKNIYMRFQ